jgi:RNA polymerase sigma-70 factor (ECF subfamily)
MWVLFSALLTGRSPAFDDDPGEPEVQRLVAAAAGGDAAAAERIYTIYVARVYRSVRPLCASDSDAEDVTQETFVRVLGALDRYQPRAGVRFVAWVLTIALNLARNRARRRRSDPMDPAKLGWLHERVGPRPEPPDRQAEQREAVDRLLAALAALSERDRKVIALRYGAGLGAAEVASILRLTPSNVRKIAERARARLLARLRSSHAQAHPRRSQETRDA